MIDDETLIQKCMNADDRGTLKLLIKRKQLYIDSEKSSPNLIPGVGDQSNKTRRKTPPEMSPPPHFTPELNQLSPSPNNNNNDKDRRYHHFAGGFHPGISERWKASQPEGLSPLSEESQDTSKFDGPITFPVPHLESSQEEENNNITTTFI